MADKGKPDKGKGLGIGGILILVAVVCAAIYFLLVRPGKVDVSGVKPAIEDIKETGGEISEKALETGEDIADKSEEILESGKEAGEAAAEKMGDLRKSIGQAIEKGGKKIQGE